MKKLHILMLNYEYPPLGGGAGVCTSEHVSGLALAGHDVTLITTFFDGTLEEEKEGNVHIIRLKSMRRHRHKSSVREMLSWMIHARKFLDTFCKVHTFDVCLAHFTFPGGYAAKYLKRKFGIPYIVISHGHDIPWFFPEQMLIYHVFLYRPIKKILAESAAVVVLNENLAKSARALLSGREKDKVRVIGNGCHTNLFTKSGSKDYTVLRILFVGRLVKQKDPMTFMRALKILNEKGENFIAEVVGNGVLLNKMKRYAYKTNLLQKVVFRGWLNRDDMPEIYSNTHVLVQSSVAEAMSVAALEALSAGVFMITTDTGVASRMIKNDINGVLVEKKNPEALAHALSVYYASKFKFKYAIPDEFLTIFRRENHWQNIIDKYNKLLSEVTE